MITSQTNTKIKHVTALISNARLRRKERTFVVEGDRIVSEIPAHRIKECYVSEDFDNFSIIPDGVNYEVVSASVFKKMSDTMTPQGILCVVSFGDDNAEDFLGKHREGALRLLVLESIQDPGNLGTMIRTAEGAGFDAVIANSGTVDVYNPKVTRSTMGSLFRVPVMYVQNLSDILSTMKELGITTYAAHLNGDKSYCEQKYSNRSAILIGNEGNGLTDEISSNCDVLVKIPMEGRLESLNASVAAALMMYEVRRNKE